jgi:anti-sigma regulatory factor (Ser/Thr protein kinase)
MSERALSFTVTNRLEEIKRASELIDAFGAAQGLPAEIIFRINLALDEIVTNIINHAYADQAGHEISIGVALEDDGVSVRVEDDGRAFNPLEVPTPDLTLTLAERPIGGLGIHLVRSMMDALEYRRENGRNILIMRKAQS